MKLNLTITFLCLVNIFLTAQSENLVPSSNNFGPSFDCYLCEFGDFNYKTGIKLGMGYGLSKEVNSLLDLNTNLSINYWRTMVNEYDENLFIESAFIHENVYFNISVGERINIVQNEKFKFFTAVNINT